MIKTVLVEFHDKWFIQDAMPDLKKRGLLPQGVGSLIGYGNEAVVYSFGPNAVIRIHPTYELQEDDAENVYQRIKNAPSGGLFARILDVGKIEGFDKDYGEDIVYAVYAVIESLTPLNREETQIIDDVITGVSQISDIEDECLRLFMSKYMQLGKSGWDIDSRNVMKRGDDYVIIDPESH